LPAFPPSNCGGRDAGHSQQAIEHYAEAQITAPGAIPISTSFLPDFRSPATLSGLGVV
jgi:hypothetical protein